MAGLREEILSLLERVGRREVRPGDALDRLAVLPFENLGFARIDLHRELRQGAPEAGLAEGKTQEQVVRIVQKMVEGGAGSVRVTRADAETRAAVRAAMPEAQELGLARVVWVARALPEKRGLVAFVSAGTADGPVLHEARIRAELLGVDTVVHEDAGVAGLHRLADALPNLARADCVVVVAGMDAALASVVGGLVASPVIGVPTSTGYGVADGGRTPLNAMLTSCAAALAVVGIDDGFGAGTVAARIARGRA